MHQEQSPADDLSRLRAEYADRARRLVGSDLYSPFNLPNLFATQQRTRQVLTALRQGGIFPLEGKRILEVGCGDGGVLFEYLTYGSQQVHLHGLDLLPERLVVARQLLPSAPLLVADGQHLPYSAGTFDLVVQYTAFSSLLDGDIKQRMAVEMLRLLRPGGAILWYDFWWNPSNPQTRGIRPAEIRTLFPGCRFDFHRITLAPPIARRIVPASWLFAAFLEKLVIFNSHYLVLIRPTGNSAG